MENLESEALADDKQVERYALYKMLFRKIGEVALEAGNVKDRAMRAGIAFAREGVLLDTPFDFPPDFDDRVIEYMRSGQYWPVILGTHKSHPAGLPLVELSNRLATICNPYLSEDEQIRGSLLILAKTMEGGQSEAVVDALKIAKPVIEKQRAEILPIIRKKDEKDFSEEQITETASNFHAKIGNAVSNGQIPLLLPEGTVESGRQKPGGQPGEINGMVRLEPRAVSHLLTRLQRGSRREPLLFFVGTTGENRIYDPITEKVTTETYVTAATRSIPLIGKHLREPIMKARVGHPVPWSELREIFGDNGRLTPEELDLVVGGKLASLLPENERGIFLEGLFRDSEEIPGRETDIV